MSIGSLLLPIKRRLRDNYGFYNRVAPIFGLYRNTRMALARLLHGIDGNLVTFSSFDGRAYNDNPRYISEALHALRPETDIVWLFKDVEKARALYAIPDYVRALEGISAEGVSALARCRVAVDNFNKRFYLNFPAKGQEYVQTWHGDRGFKRVGYDSPLNPVMLEEKCSLVLAGSDFGVRLYHTAFHCRGEIVTVGSPRNDILIRNDPAECAAVRARLGLDKDCRALLYAPTFRDVERRENRAHRAHMDLCHVLDTLERTTGARWKCLVRAHYLSYGISLTENSDRLIPVTDYPEMAELLLASDALLTDYSSSAGDFALLRRPIYLYQDDFDDFKDRNREFYFDMKDSHYWIATNPGELDRLIETTTPERARENCEAVLRFYGEAETGHAARFAAEYIAARLDGGKCSKKGN